LVQNVSFRATELKHYLNETEDSLILEGERTIYTVNIFIKDYDETIEVKIKKCKHNYWVYNKVNSGHYLKTMKK